MCDSGVCQKVMDDEDSKGRRDREEKKAREKRNGGIDGRKLRRNVHKDSKRWDRQTGKEKRE